MFLLISYPHKPGSMEESLTDPGVTYLKIIDI